jgi:hypothetical protein
MRFSDLHIYLFVIFFSLPVIISGQIYSGDFDTIYILKPKKNKLLYQFRDLKVKEILILITPPEKIQNKNSDKLLRDLGLDLATAVSGIGFDSEKEVTWKTGGVIRCDNVFPDWLIDLYCAGSQIKTRERVRDEDGWSIENEIIDNFYWDRNAIGTIVEGSDTIGHFLIIMNPHEDTLIKPWSDYVYSQPASKPEIGEKMKFNFLSDYSLTDIDFGIVGKIRGRDMIIVSNGSDHKKWFFSENELEYIFQQDLDDDPFVKKKDRIMPYLLVNKNLSDSEKYDMYKLAIMSRILDYKLR